MDQWLLSPLGLSQDWGLESAWWVTLSRSHSPSGPRHPVLGLALRPRKGRTQPPRGLPLLVLELNTQSATKVPCILEDFSG